MRRKGRKQIAILITLMFLFSFFPGYGLAEETGGQDLPPVTESILSDSDLINADLMNGSPNDPLGDGAGEDLGQSPEEPNNQPINPPADPPSDLPNNPPANEPGDEENGDSEGFPEGEPADISQQVANLEEAVIGTELIVNYVLLNDDGDRVQLKSVTLPNLTSGDTVKGTELLTSEYESMQFLYSEPEELILVEGENTITLFYGEEEIVGDNPDNLSEFSTGITPAEPFYYPPAKRMMLMTKMLLNAESGLVWPAQGAINLQKTAAPVEGTENQWEVTLTVEGKNIQTTSDVVLVIDRSGSMSGNKMSNTKLAAKEFVDKLLLTDGATRIAVVSFNANAQVVSQFTDYSGKAGLQTNIEGITATGGTNIQAGIHQAQILLEASQATNKVMVLLGDGEPTYSYQVTEASGITLTGHSGWLSTPDIEYSNPQITAINYDNIVGSGGDYPLTGWGSSSSWRYQIPCDDHGSHATDFPANNGIPTIYEAGLAKSAGIQIYSIALNAGSNGEYVLNNCQDKGYYQLNSSDLTALSGVFSEIAGNIAYAATNADVTDPMGAMFDLVADDVTDIRVSQGSVTINPANTINWNVGNVVEGTPATMTYIVQIKAGAAADQLYPTNDTTTISYTDVNGLPASKDFEIPEVSIGGGRILIKGYLVNDSGQPINSEGTVVDRPDQAFRLYENSYSNEPLAYNVTYNVTQPGHSGHQYVKYVWNSQTGTAETVPILLQASAPTQTVWFGYKEVYYYTVTWLDEDGTELEKDLNVLYGTTPSYDGTTPSKAATAEFTYTFAGWTPAISPVTGDATYTATYSAATNAYTVTWLDEDGTELEKDLNVLYGTIPSYDGTTPSKAATAEFTYTFAGWTPAISPVTGDATYTATYSAATNAYTVTYRITGSYFTDDEYATETYEFGADVTAIATPKRSGYIFHGWNGVPQTMPAKDVVVTGYYTKTGGGGGYDPEPKEPIEIVEEEVAIPLNKDDHFAYIVGYPDNTVQPEGIITREEVAAVFYRLLDANYRETIKTTSNDFPDVGLDRWSSKHIGTLASVGIVVGYPDGSFRPGNSITRAEIATIASKFDKLSPFTDNSFSDITGHWANQYINSAAKKGWVNGYPDGTFKPDQAITRAEFMTLVNNVLERRVQKENILPDAKKFPDLSSNEWYYEEVQEAINSHYYQRATRQDYEEWTEIYYPELDM